MTKLWFAALVVFVSGCGSTASKTEKVSASESALTDDQCMYFQVDGKTRICHKTSSTTHPYTVLNIGDNACISAHAAHADDYVASNDPTCAGRGCLPEGAPCDSTLP